VLDPIPDRVEQAHPLDHVASRAPRVDRRFEYELDLFPRGPRDRYATRAT
jgi:hypothetical protein